MPYNKKTGQLIINEWETGIGESSARGFLDMRNCDPFRKPGYLECAIQAQNEWDTPFTGTMTANTTTDILTSSVRIVRREAFLSGALRAITFSSTGTLPSPLVAGTVYFITTNGSLGTFQFNVSTTLANAEAGVFIDITTTGTGTHTVSSLNMGTPLYIRQAQYNNLLYLLDSNKRIWQRGSSFWTLLTGNTLSGGVSYGLATWKNYLVVFRGADIDLYSLVSSTWTNSWQTGLSTSVSDKVPFVSNDGVLYFYGDLVQGTKYYVGSLVEETTFNPADSASYTFNTQALDLPDPITRFEDLGADLVIGTSNSVIHRWDRVSTTYGDPITILEPNVSAMKTFNNILYFSSGVKGNIYLTYGTTPEKFLDISDEMLQTIRYQGVVTSISFNSNEMLFFLSAPFQGASGLYSCNLQDRSYHIKYKLSQGYGVQNATMYAVVGQAGTTNDNFYIGYSVSNVAYIDTLYPFSLGISTTVGYISYAITPLYEVGTADQPKTFQHMQLQLARPLTNSSSDISGGGSVRISSRKNLFDAFTNTMTFDSSSTNMGTERDSYKQIVNVEDCQFIQFKIELQSADTIFNEGQISYNTPTIKSIIVL